MAARKVSNREGTGAIDMPVQTLKTRMSTMVINGSGIVLDRNDIIKLSTIMPTIDSEIIKCTLGAVTKKEIITLDYFTKNGKFYLENGKYLGYLRKLPTLIEGCSKYELKFFKTINCKEFMDKILDDITYSSGLRISFEEFLTYKRLDEFSMTLKTTMIRLTNDAWSIKRTLEKPYNLTKQSYNVDKTTLLNRFWLSSESVSNIEVMNLIASKFPTLIDREISVSTMKDDLNYYADDFIAGSVLFGVVE